MTNGKQELIREAAACSLWAVVEQLTIEVETKICLADDSFIQGTCVVNPSSMMLHYIIAIQSSAYSKQLECPPVFNSLYMVHPESQAVAGPET